MASSLIGERKEKCEIFGSRASESCKNKFCLGGVFKQLTLGKANFNTSKPLVRQRPSDSGVGTAVTSFTKKKKAIAIGQSNQRILRCPQRVTRAKSKCQGLDDTREHIRLQHKEARQQHIRIRREEAGSPVILEATGFDVEATIFHVEPVATDLHICIEDIEQLYIPTIPEEKSSGSGPL